MTIRGDLEFGLKPRLKEPGDAREAVKEFFDFLTDGNTLSYLLSQEFTQADLILFSDAVTALKQKCLTGEVAS